jgi:hypothetical protein
VGANAVEAHQLLDVFPKALVIVARHAHEALQLRKAASPAREAFGDVGHGVEASALGGRALWLGGKLRSSQLGLDAAAIQRLS